MEELTAIELLRALEERLLECERKLADPRLEADGPARPAAAPPCDGTTVAGPFRVQGPDGRTLVEVGTNGSGPYLRLFDGGGNPAEVLPAPLSHGDSLASGRHADAAPRPPERHNGCPPVNGSGGAGSPTTLAGTQLLFPGPHEWTRARLAVRDSGGGLGGRETDHETPAPCGAHPPGGPRLSAGHAGPTLAARVNGTSRIEEVGRVRGAAGGGSAAQENGKCEQRADTAAAAPAASPESGRQPTPPDSDLALRAYHRAGRKAVGVYVESGTGVFKIYDQAGMEVFSRS